MNRQIVQLFGLSMLLFATLIAFTSRWSVFEASSLEDEPANKRPLIEEQRIPRGLILARNGTVLARSVRHGSGSRRTYVRSYPTNGLFSHAIGYNFISKGRVGLERSRNDELTGKENEFSSIFSQLQSEDREGEDVTTTLDPKGQRTALAAVASG
jgi:peptidoglycan glycosyltransferase